MSDPLIGDELPTDPKELQRLVHEMTRRQTLELKFSASEEYRQRLMEAFAQLVAKQERFEPGQLVRWKTGLANRTMPDTSSVGIVIQHIDTPMIVDKDSGSAYFQEPLDLALGIIVGDERSFVIYWFDSRRFEKAD